jgi:hypothetical protein
MRLITANDIEDEHAVALSIDTMHDRGSLADASTHCQ